MGLRIMGDLSLCRLCHSDSLWEIAAFHELPRVASDCRPWPAGGRLAVCRACGMAQKIADDAFRRESDEIYRTYDIYPQTGGAEQVVFASQSAEATSRSSRMLACLVSVVPLRDTGRLLDVGCGNGGFLKAFSSRFPRWELHGSELSTKFEREVLAINGVKSFYSAPPEKIPGTFDLVVMSHVLEHIEDPVGFLEHVKERLARDALLFVEVPDHEQNPFELAIADHCNHFSLESLARTFRRAGLGVVVDADDWVAKEISMVGRPNPGIECSDPAHPDKAKTVGASVGWLQRVADEAAALARHGKFGIFGTSIAASWLFGKMSEHVAFFVDEDLQRTGRTYLDRPVYAPADAPSGSRIFICLPMFLARRVASRLSALPVSIHLPPAPE